MFLEADLVEEGRVGVEDFLRGVAVEGADQQGDDAAGNHGVAVGTLPQAKYTEYTLTLVPGDAIFVYTDGVPEANNSKGEMYGMERLNTALNRKSGLPPTEILRAVRRDVDTFVGDATQFDDLTMLCLEYRGTAGEEQ